MKTVLITGAAGFIGSHLCEHLLKQGYGIIGIDNFDPFYDRSIKEKNLETAMHHPNFRFHEADITQSNAYTSITQRVDAVIHLAAKCGVRPSIHQPLEYIHTNITGTQSLINWMVLQSIDKLVFASSSSVYGNNPKVPFSETDPVDAPVSPYAFTKKACELMTHSAHRLHGMSVVNLRFFTVIGERQRPDLALHRFVTAIRKGEAVQMFGSGDSARDYTYVGDIVSGIEAALRYVDTKQVYEIINLGNSHPVVLREMIAAIFRQLGVKEQIDALPPQPGDVERTYADISSAQQLLGFKPQTPFETAVQKFIAWHRQQFP